MLLNGFIAWNMSAKEGNGDNKYELPKWEFYAFVAEELLKFKDDDSDDDESDDDDDDDVEDVTPGSEFATSINFPHAPAPTGLQGIFRERCRVCMLENKKKIGGAMRQTSIAQCKRCGVVAHLRVPENSKHMKVFGFPQFTGLSCMEIAHHHSCKGVWSDRPGHPQLSYSVKTSHPLYTRIKQECGITPKTGRKKPPPE